MNLPGASNRLIHDPQAARCWRGIKIRTVDGEIVEKQVLRDVVDGDVEARRICEVEDLEAELEGSLLGQLRELHQREVGPFLPGLAEDVALTGGEIGFVSVARRNRTTQIARTQEWQGETSGIQRRRTWRRPTSSSQSLRR